MSGRGRDARAAKDLVPSDAPDPGVPADEPEPPQDPPVVVDEEAWANPSATVNTVLAASRRLREQLVANLDVTTAALAEERALHRATAQRLARVEDEFAAARAAWDDERAALGGGETVLDT